MRCLLVLAIALVFSTGAGAAIVYVDAVDGISGNTYATGGSLGDTSWYTPKNSSANDETHWDKRAFANNGTVYQASHLVGAMGEDDDMPELTTELSGLADGTYELFAFFWEETNTQTWTIDAGLTSGALTSYQSPLPGTAPGATSVGVSYALDLDFEGAPPLIVDSSRRLFAASLGFATVSGGSTINIHVDNSVGGSATNRTWYDGVGYKLVVPEPGSCLLMSLCLLGSMASSTRS